ncbi:Glycerophosphoryl diester phosphodiesterase [Planctomycetes bacterium Pan216]|uniref:Glycerophosphoryl diester phosphodiesterase n=1 Tax=Kolteria novifilia TaxID=2527975 RepID=A0A518AYP3_9BACT|nr:Glycerophosphoryl diester phosphodiesterase [Planctomycetes bacterium Pan216]
MGEPTAPTEPRRAWRSFAACWQSLVITDLFFKVVAFVVLTPLVAISLRTLLAFAGTSVLCDVDIARFLLGPVGWLVFVLVGALWLGIVALEQASLLGILVASRLGKLVGPVPALRYAFSHGWSVLKVTARIVALVLAAIAPFVIVAGLVYVSLLSRYDINYYLKERPPVFHVAVGIGALLSVGLMVTLLWLVTRWFYALPLVLFEGNSGITALKLSAERTRGGRGAIVGWLVGWLLATSLVSLVLTAFVGLVGRAIVPASTGSLHLLAFAVGAVLLLGGLANLVVNLLGTISFATLLSHLYLERGRATGADPISIELGHEAPPRVIGWMTPKRLLVAGVIGGFLAALIGASSLGSVRLEDDVLVMAHRGSSKAAPENTLASFRQAIADGADWIELDVQETADGEVVVFHDSDLMKLAGENLKIWDATTDQLGSIDIGGWFGDEFTDQRVPTLAEVLRICKGKIGVNIELKYYGHDQDLERRVARIVGDAGMNDEVMAMSLEAAGVRTMKKIRPQWRVGQLMSVSIGNVKKIEADFLAVNAAFVDRSLVERVHRNGKQIFVWTVNDAATMSTMIGRGVDGLLTDKPALARRVLEQRAEMSPAQRLLLELSPALGVSPKIDEQ